MTPPQKSLTGGLVVILTTALAIIAWVEML